MNPDEKIRLSDGQLAYRDAIRKLLLDLLPIAGGALASEGLNLRWSNSVIINELLTSAAATALQNAREDGREPSRELWLKRCGEAYEAVAKAAQKAESAPVSVLDRIIAASKPSGEACTHCGNFSLVRSGTCMTCQACGETTGCS